MYGWVTGSAAAGAERLIVAAAIVVGDGHLDPRAARPRPVPAPHLRRRWALACRHAELATTTTACPRIIRCRARPGPGSSSGSGCRPAARCPTWRPRPSASAAFLAVREVRVVRDPASARQPAWSSCAGIRWPTRPRSPGRWSGAVVRCRCGSPSRSARTRTATRSRSPCPSATCSWAGEPGAGKSNVLQLLVAVGALDPVGAADPVRSQAGRAGRLARQRRPAGRPECRGGHRGLKELIAELDDRYLTLLANRARKVTEGDGLPCIWWGSRSWPTSPTAPTARRPSLLGPAPRLRGPGPSRRHGRRWRPPRSRRLMWSRPSCAICSGSAGRSGAPPPRRRTPSSARAGPPGGLLGRLIDPAARGVGLLFQEGGVPVRLRSCWLDDRGPGRAGPPGRGAPPGLTRTTAADVRLVE